MRSCSDPQHDPSLFPARYLLVGVVGLFFAIFGLVANCLLATLFLSRSHYRHSPFFFLGFVALFDTLLDFVYILLLAIPIHAEALEVVSVLHAWIEVTPALFYLGQIFKMASTFCLIVASIERYCMTKHWTFTGFEARTRWIVLVLVIAAAILLKILTMAVVVIERPYCPPLQRYIIGSETRNDSYFMRLIGLASIAMPFATLIFLNGGIVMMLRRQNVQQLRSLITELTMGHDVMRIRRKNLRSATHTLLAIITAYLISNTLNLILSFLEFSNRDYLFLDHPIFYVIASDVAGVLTAVGNAIRCPAHFVSNSEVRQQFQALLCGEPKQMKSMLSEPASPAKRHCRLGSDGQSAFPFSLLLSVRPEDSVDDDDDAKPVFSPTHNLPTSPFLFAAPPSRLSFKRHSAIAIC